MKAKVVSSEDINPDRGLRAADYFLPDKDAPCWPGIRAVARLCFETAKQKGWWEGYEGREMTPDELSSKLCLIHSEVSEALEEVRSGRPVTETRFTIPLESTGDAIVGQVREGAQEPGDKPEGFASELADVVIRVFDLCGYLGIDIAEVIRMKMAYNEQRTYKHGGKTI
jgi:NTP pyrophosphatase (non-canonical NTP hydrolase)